MSRRRYICNHRHAALGATPPRWNKPAVSWKCDVALPGLSADVVRGVLVEALAHWAGPTGLVFQEWVPPVPSWWEFWAGRRPRVLRPDLTVELGRIDGRSNVLAWCELPPGDNRPIRLRLDGAERWGLGDHLAEDAVSLAAVLLHEIGHGIGLEHTSDGTGQVMDPWYTPDAVRLTPGDLERAKKLYGR